MQSGGNAQVLPAHNPDQLSLDERISTAAVESILSRVIKQCMAKGQPVRWNRSTTLALPDRPGSPEAFVVLKVSFSDSAVKVSHFSCSRVKGNATGSASFFKNQDQVSDKEQKMNSSLKHVRAFEGKSQHADRQREQ